MSIPRPSLDHPFTPRSPPVDGHFLAKALRIYIPLSHNYLEIPGQILLVQPGRLLIPLLDVIHRSHPLPVTPPPTMDADTEKAKQSLSTFESSLTQLDQSIRPVLSALDEIRAKRATEDLDPMTTARLHISLCYTVNSLFCMYLRTQGIDPNTHPVIDQITRVQEAFMRMRKVQAGVSAEFRPLPDRDRRKHIENMLASEAKLSALVFPQERHLVRALQNLKQIEKQEGKSGEMENGEDDGLEHIRMKEDDLKEMENIVEKRDQKAALKKAKKDYKEKKREMKAEKAEKHIKKKRKRAKRKKKSES